MVNLATSQDVEARLGRPLSATETARVDALLADASAEVRAYTGQLITPGTSTVTLPVVGGRVLLPQRPVTAIEVVDGEPVTDPDLIGASLRGLWGCEATVTYSHGYAEVPADLVSVVCAMVLRGLGSAPTGEGKSSETIGDYSYRLAASTLARRPVVDVLDRAVLDRYRTPDIGAVWLARP